VVFYFEQTQAEVQQWVGFHWTERESLWDVLWPHLKMPPGKNIGGMLPSVDDPPDLVTPWRTLTDNFRVYNQIGQVGVAANVAIRSLNTALNVNAALRRRIELEVSQ
jgi:hypothetical protein